MPHTDAHPLEVFLLIAWLAVEALALVLAAAAPTQQPEPPSLAVDHLPVVELRKLARAAGYRNLARSGRRAELLAALA